MTSTPGRARAAVVGMGVLTPAGNVIDDFWSALLTGKSCARPIRSIDTTEWPVKFACEVPGFHSGQYLTSSETRRLDRATQFAIGAAANAVSQAGDIRAAPERRGIIVGTGVGGLGTFLSQVDILRRKGFVRASPYGIPMAMSNATAANLSIRFSARGPSMTLCSACTAGAEAIGEALRLIRDGTADFVLAGGTDAPILEPVLLGFARLGALSRRNDDPERASRPFDAQRDGFVLGEGAAFLAIERWDEAASRGATILGEVLGYGHTSDAHHMVAPSPDGVEAARCMKQALADARLTSNEICHINAHGTSTPINDVVEANAIRSVFGDFPPPVTSSKGVIGHLIGAAGAAEAIATLLSVQSGMVPPTANHEFTDDQVSVDIVSKEPRRTAKGAALSNSFAFGGHNVSLVLSPGSPEP